MLCWLAQMTVYGHYSMQRRQLLAVVLPLNELLDIFKECLCVYAFKSVH